MESQYIVTRKVKTPKDIIKKLIYKTNEEIISTSALQDHLSSKISILQEKKYSI
jgi:hypothetical protein